MRFSQVCYFVIFRFSIKGKKHKISTNAKRLLKVILSRYIQVDGKLVAIYDTGPQVHILTMVGNYSDGAYHTVKFRRTLANSSLIVDEQTPVTSTHQGYFYFILLMSGCSLALFNYLFL